MARALRKTIVGIREPFMALAPEDRRRLVQALEELDPGGTVARLDSDGETVTYADVIRSDEGLVRRTDAEELTRAVSLALLASSNFAYRPEDFYIERRYTIGHPSTSGAEVDLIIYDRDGLPFAMWEMKEPSEYDAQMEASLKHQLFDTAPQLGEPRFLVYSTLKTLRTPAIQCVVIDYSSYKSLESWDAAGRPQADAFPPDFQLPSYDPYINGGPRDLDESVTTEDFRAIAASFHTEFFSEHPDTDLFASLVKCLLAKIWDERNTAQGKRYAFQILQRNGKEESARDVFTRVNEIYAKAYGHYIEKGGDDVIDERLFAPERVKTVVKSLQRVALTRGAALHGDIIGTFFEEILRAGFKQDKGMYFTHTNLVWFMLEAVGLEELTIRRWSEATHPSERMPYVIDPSCGSGSFLLRAMQVMTESVRSRRDSLVVNDEALDYFSRSLPDHRPNAWAQDFIYGIDPKFVMAITAKVNMVLHGDGSAHILKWDALAPFGTSGDTRLKTLSSAARSFQRTVYGRDLCEAFDVVVSNPPFGITLSSETKRSLKAGYTLPESSPSEVLFLERWFQLLRAGGRLAVVVPESLLNTAEADDARQFLYRFFWIRAVVALPRNLFVETPTLTSLLFAQKKSKAEVATWDATINRAQRVVEERVRRALRFLAGAKRRMLGDDEIQAGFLSEMGDLVGIETMLSSPRSRSLLPIRLPRDVQGSAKAVAYYRQLLKSGPFAQLVRNRVFGEAAEEADYPFPVFMTDEAGFKLSKRGERARPNELCAFVDPTSGAEVSNLRLTPRAVRVEVDTTNPARVLDYIRRDVVWT